MKQFISVFGTLVVTGIVNSMVSPAQAVVCAYPAFASCAVPADVQVCLSPTSTAQCVANKQGVYPLVDSQTKVPIEGCYTEKYQRVYDLDGNRSCVTHPNAPIRVELFYTTTCSSDRPKCLNGANVTVQPIIKADSTLGSIKMILPDANLQSVSLKNNSQSNSSKAFCNSLYGNGYAYNATTKQCEISIEAQCRLLGMEYDVLNNKCISDICAASVCTAAVTEKVCKGYTVNPSGQACVCKGTALILDGNGARCDDCSGKATSAPIDTQKAISSWSAGGPGLGLVGYWRLKGNVSNEVPGGYPLQDGTTTQNLSLFQSLALRPMKFTSSDPLMGDAAIFDGRSFFYVSRASGDSSNSAIGKNPSNSATILQPTGTESRTIMAWLYTEDRHSFNAPMFNPTAGDSFITGGRLRTPLFQGHGNNGGSFAFELGGNNNFLNSTTSTIDGASASKLGRFYNWTVAGYYAGFDVPQVTSIPNSGWWHVALQWDNSSKKMKLFVNGVKVTEGTDGNPLNTFAGPFIVGGTEAGSNTGTGANNGGDFMFENYSIGKFFYGRMREVAMFNAALTDAQILDIYSKSNKGFCESPGTPSYTGNKNLNLVVANEMPYIANTQESSVTVQDKTGGSLGYSLDAYNGELITSVNHATGTSAYQVLQPSAITLNVTLNGIKGSPTAYVRIYNNGYDVQKGPIAVGETAQFAGIPLNGLDKMLIVHVSTSSIPKSSYGRTRVFFTRSACYDDNTAANRYLSTFTLGVSDFDRGIKLSGTAPAGFVGADTGVNHGVRDLTNLPFDPHSFTSPVNGGGAAGGFEGTAASTQFASSGKITFTDAGSHVAVNNFTWNDINIDGYRDGDSARALNFTVTNSTSVTAPTTCKADAYMINNDSGYTRTTGLNSGPSTIAFNNVFTTNRGGYSQNAHIVVGATTPAGVGVTPAGDTPSCYIAGKTMIATNTSNGKIFISSGLPTKIDCSATYDLKYINQAAFTSAVSAYTSGATGVVTSPASCTQTCLVTDPAYRTPAVAVGRATVTATDGSTADIPASGSTSDGVMTCTGVTITGSGGGITTQVLWKSSCP